MRLPAVLLAAILHLALAGCSGGDGYASPERDAQGRYVIRLTEANTFEPGKAEVPVGATVVWRVEGGFHDVSEEQGRWSSADGQPLDGQGFPMPMGPGDEYGRTFNETATYTLWCHMHHEEGMRMVLKVA